MKTKIIATLGPASNSRSMILRLIQAGVSIFRLNFSHGEAASFVELINTIRSLEMLVKKPLTIMQDLSGPKIRIGNLSGEGSISVAQGDKLLLGPSACFCKELPYIPFDNEAVFSELEADDCVVLADGSLHFVVIEKRADGLFVLESQNTGFITSRKGLALPGKALNLPALTEKDRRDLKEGLALGVDAVALSYVQGPKDVVDAKELIRELGYCVPVVAKLERQCAVDSLGPILEEADIIMVARGDLGVECPLAELPSMQKRIIQACNEAAKPVIVATQMLLSMVSSPSPTRAEVTDVANAVLDGADCVMLSEETAMGEYPVETVNFMNDITTRAENFLEERASLVLPDPSHAVSDFLAYAACLLAEKSKAKAIVIHSLSGQAVRLVSSLRPSRPVHALTLDKSVLKALNFSWGVLPQMAYGEGVTHLERVERYIASSPLFVSGDEIIITAGQPNKDNQDSTSTNLVKIYRK